MISTEEVRSPILDHVQARSSKRRACRLRVDGDCAALLLRQCGIVREDDPQHWFQKTANTIAKTPPKVAGLDMLSVPERLLLFCVTSGTEPAKAGIIASDN